MVKQREDGNRADHRRRASDRRIYQAAVRAERVIIAAIAAIAAREVGHDIRWAIVALVALMALAELTDWALFQRGYRSLLRDLDNNADHRGRVSSGQPGAGNKRRRKRSRAQCRDHQKIDREAHKHRS